MSSQNDQTAPDKFYVYEHWRPDTNCCFYVGKGHGDRAFRLNKRNRHHRHITRKLSELGLSVEVRIISDRMSEPDALAFEIERIKFWREAQGFLTNITDGGDGVSGLVHSDQSKELMRLKRKAQKVVHSEATRKKIAAANRIAHKGKKNPDHSARMTGRRHSPEHRAKISAGNIGKVPSVETRQKISAANKGRIVSDEARAKMRAAQLGRKNPEHSLRMSGRKLSEEHRAKIGAAGKGRPGPWAGKTPSAETRAKLSAAATRQWAQRRAIEKAI